MIVPVRQWTFVRPIRVALRARKVQQARPTQVRESKPKAGLFDQMNALMAYNAELILRAHTTE